MRLDEILTNLKTIFQKKIKNLIQLENDSNLESNLKFLKVDDKSTPIQISEDEVNIQGSLNVNGSAVQTGTDAGATELNELSDVTYSSGDLTIASLDTIVSGGLTFDSSGDINLDSAGLVGVRVVGNHLAIDSTKALYLDGNQVTRNTYIHEVSGDVLGMVVGGDTMIQLSEKGDDGNEVSFGSSCVGFTQLEPTYDATNTIVDFRFSNKQNLTFGSGNITNIQLNFPLVSGNFTLLIKQDGTGSRTITNYRVYEFDESTADGDAAVKFAGGSNPTLTTDANHVDIISFYWDADNEIAYGVATLDFQD